MRFRCALDRPDKKIEEMLLDPVNESLEILGGNFEVEHVELVNDPAVIVAFREDGVEHVDTEFGADCDHPDVRQVSNDGKQFVQQPEGHEQFARLTLEVDGQQINGGGIIYH